MSSELIERKLRADLDAATEQHMPVMVVQTAYLSDLVAHMLRLQAELAEARKQALTEAHRIAKAAQYSKTPATDTMRGIERLLQDEPYPAGNCPP